jgi:hypothetical protein
MVNEILNLFDLKKAKLSQKTKTKTKHLYGSLIKQFYLFPENFKLSTNKNWRVKTIF